MDIESVSKRHSLHVFFVVILFLIFTMTILSVLMYGTGIYKNIALKTGQSFNERTGLMYISNKIRAYDDSNKIYKSTFADGDSLVIEQEISGDIYETIIYVYEGRLYELFIEKGTEVPPSSGSALLPASSMEIESLNDSSLLKIIVTGEANEENCLFINV